jgi:hypothetical protein
VDASPAPPYSPAMDRALGLLLFLPVPIVLWLFTRAPLGVLPSLALGSALVASHRSYARPFALARAGRRCLYCGGVSRPEAPGLEVREPLGTTSWKACSADHARRLASVLAWAERHARFVRVGILGTLAAFLAVAALAGGGLLAPERYLDAVAFFRLGVAVTVLPLGWLSERQPPSHAPRVPLPLHIQALVGSWAVLWLFRLVGLWWLAAGLRHVASRLGLAG